MTRKSKIRPLSRAAGWTFLVLLACAQPNIALAPAGAQATSVVNVSPSIPRPSLPNYKLGPDDEIIIYAPYAEELSNKRFRIEKSGDVILPNPVGRVYAEGRTVEELAADIAKKLAVIIRSPDVVVRVDQPRSQPVTIFGSVNTPGEVQLEGGKTLVDVLSKAGWFRNDAGSRVKITRLIENGPIPLPNSINDQQYSIAEVSVSSLQNGTRPEENIRLLPHDVIAVPRADIVYIVGGVLKPGGYALNEMKTISLIALLGQAGGTTPTAKTKSATIFRKLPDGSHTSLEVNIVDEKKLKPGKPELMLQADDILDIPDSLVKGTVRRTFDQAVSSIIGIAIYRPFY
jgi:polysaccharide biosynthesis/export protein